MTDLVKAALEQALEALELADYHLTPNINISAKLQQPIANLKDAIEQQEWKPDPNWISALEKLMPHPAPTTAPGWQPIETAPKTGRTVLLGYFNSLGNWRTMRGQWFSKEAIAEGWESIEDDDPAELEGWYETSVEADDVPNCWRTEPTHWMPLPTLPEK